MPKKDFVRFLDIAESSAAEVKSILYVALDEGNVHQDEVQAVQNQCDEAQNLTLGLLRYVHRNASRNPPTVHEPKSACDIFLEQREPLDLPEDLIY